jgi:hypothetical protein
MKSQIYIACELVQAEPMNECDFITKVKAQQLKPFEKIILKKNNGYKVHYQDNQIAWIPSNLFESFFRALSRNENSLLAKSLIESNDK